MAAVEPDVRLSPRRVGAPLDNSSNPGPGLFSWRAHTTILQRVLEARGLEYFNSVFMASLVYQPQITLSFVLLLFVSSTDSLRCHTSYGGAQPTHEEFITAVG